LFLTTIQVSKCEHTVRFKSYTVH